MKNQPQQPAHTKGEWKFHKDAFGTATILSEDRLLIAEINRQRGDEEYIANAQRIVKAVNMHDELVEVLRERISQLEEYIEHSRGVFDVSAEIEKLNKANQLLKQAEQK